MNEIKTEKPINVIIKAGAVMAAAERKTHQHGLSA